MSSSSSCDSMSLPTVLRSEIQYKSFVKIREDVLRLEDGSEYKYYVHQTRARVAMVLAFTDTGRVLVNVRLSQTLRNLELKHSALSNLRSLSLSLSVLTCSLFSFSVLFLGSLSLFSLSVLSLSLSLSLFSLFSHLSSLVSHLSSLVSLCGLCAVFLLARVPPPNRQDSARLSWWDG